MTNHLPECGVPAAQKRAEEEGFAVIPKCICTELNLAVYRGRNEERERWEDTERAVSDAYQEGFDHGFDTKFIAVTQDLLNKVARIIEEECIESEHHDASHVHWESDYVLCENCKGLIEAVRKKAHE